jgi:hypothetical protein
MKVSPIEDLVFIKVTTNEEKPASYTDISISYLAAHLKELRFLTHVKETITRTIQHPGRSVQLDQRQLLCAMGTRGCTKAIDSLVMYF